MAENFRFIFDPYGLAFGSVESSPIIGMPAGAGGVHLGPPVAIGAVIARFSTTRNIEVTPEAANLLISVTLELTVLHNIGTAANPRYADYNLFFAGLRRLAEYLEYMRARLDGVPTARISEFDISWLEGLSNEDGLHVFRQYYSVRKASADGFVDFLSKEKAKKITALLAAAWMPDFVKNIECSCWPV